MGLKPIDKFNFVFRFYSSKSLLIVDEERRRAEQEEFLRIEQGDSDVEEIGKSDEDDDELARWEQEQIRKGVSYQKVTFIKRITRDLF